MKKKNLDPCGTSLFTKSILFTLIPCEEIIYPKWKKN